MRHFTKQLLEGLRFLDYKEIIHCDLKPENILLSDPVRGMVKIIDFGSSCYESEKVYTYIQSRFYRSPEVILGMVYNQRIDMWSLGCIIAELLTGHPLFMGENEQEQIACIMEIFGVPEKSMISQCSRRKLFFDSIGNPRIHVSSKNVKRYPGTKSLKKALKSSNDLLVDFLSQFLVWNPRNRLAPSNGLHHEFITGIANQGQNSRKDSYSSLISVNSVNLPVHETYMMNSTKPVAPSHGSSAYAPMKLSQQYNTGQNTQSSTLPKDQTRPLPTIPTAGDISSGRRESAPLMKPKTSGEYVRHLSTSSSNSSKYGSQRQPSGPRPLGVPSSSIEAAAHRTISGGTLVHSIQTGQHDNLYYTGSNSLKGSSDISSNAYSSPSPAPAPPFTLKTSKSSSSLISMSSGGSSVVHKVSSSQSTSQKYYRGTSGGSAISRPG